MCSSGYSNQTDIKIHISYVFRKENKTENEIEKIDRIAKLIESGNKRIADDQKRWTKSMKRKSTTFPVDEWRNGKWKWNENTVNNTLTNKKRAWWKNLWCDWRGLIINNWNHYGWFL